MNEQTMEQAALALAATRRSGTALSSLPVDAQPDGIEQAYVVQKRLHQILVEQDDYIVAGHKIGCTTKVMQQYLKIDTPCAGKLFAHAVHENEGRYARETLCRPGVECEIAVLLEQDLPVSDQPYSIESVAHAVGGVMASIELVDDRWQDFTSLPAPSLIADDFFGAGCVHGPVQRVPTKELHQLTGRMWVNGELVGEGVGSDILGHPLEALAWLANLRAAQGAPLGNGELVTLGSIVKTQWIDVGDRVEMEIDGLGTARLLVE